MAYFISGHGANDVEPFIVPEGCYIVVKMDTCVLANHTRDYAKSFEKLTTLDQNLLLNPKEHQQELREKLGYSFIIYGPGDKAPGFNYNLLAIFVPTITATGQPTGAIKTDKKRGSGLIDLIEYQNTPEKREEIDEYLQSIFEDAFLDETKEFMISYLSYLFYYSIYPTSEDVETYLTERWKSEKYITLGEMIVDLNNYPKFRITQEELCKRYKGVYYHSACRPSEPTSNKIFMEKRMKEIPRRTNIERKYHTQRNLSSLKNQSKKELVKELENTTREMKLLSRYVTMSNNMNTKTTPSIKNKRNKYDKLSKKSKTLQKLLNERNEPPGNTTLWGGVRKTRKNKK